MQAFRPSSSSSFSFSNEELTLPINLFSTETYKTRPPKVLESQIRSSQVAEMLLFARIFFLMDHLYSDVTTVNRTHPKVARLYLLYYYSHSEQLLQNRKQICIYTHTFKYTYSYHLTQKNRQGRISYQQKLQKLCLTVYNYPSATQHIK